MQSANVGVVWVGTVTGTLKGYDQLMNLVLDDVKEVLRGMGCSSESSNVCSKRLVYWISH